MNKEYYIKKYESKWKECFTTAQKNTDVTDVVLEATEHFEECANAEEVVGYYLALHGESAYQDWCENIAHLKESNSMSEQDLNIDNILKQIHERMVSVPENGKISHEKYEV